MAKQTPKYRIVNYGGNGRVLETGCSYRKMLAEKRGATKVEPDRHNIENADCICVTKWYGESWEDSEIIEDKYYQF